MFVSNGALCALLCLIHVAVCGARLRGESTAAEDGRRLGPGGAGGEARTNDRIRRPMRVRPSTYPDSNAGEASFPDDVNTERSVYSHQGPLFNVTLPLLFSGSNASGGVYTNETKLRLDLWEICKFYVNQVVQGSPVIPNFAPIPMEADMGTGGPSAEGATSYATNNQENGVDEGDRVKSDGIFVYAAYGDTVVVWNAYSGEWVANETLPDNMGSRRMSLLAPSEVRPSIKSMLLYSNRLVIIAGGYSNTAMKLSGYSGMPALSNFLATTIRVYETSSSGGLTFLKETHVNGQFAQARSIGRDAHVVTRSSLSYHAYFDDNLYPWHSRFDNMTDEEFYDAARRLATDELIPQFVDELIRDLSITGDLLLMHEIGLWQTHVSNNSNFESSIYHEGIVTEISQVTSFDMMDTINVENVTVSTSGSFMPSDWGYSYATPEMIVLVGQGWDYIPELNGTAETTYLVCLNVLSASTTPAALGVIPGYVLDQYSIDIDDNHVRVASTYRNIWPFSISLDAAVLIQPFGEPQNQIIILEIPVFSDNSIGMLTETGRISDLGRPGELFTALRFFDNVAYAVTFERTDPFYALDLSSVTHPIILGELNVTGFSSYMHSINQDNTLILAVGVDADANGVRVGLQISLFDVHEPTTPSLLHRLSVNNSDSRWVSSDVLWDFKAFRYLPLDYSDNNAGIVETQGVLLIPLAVYGQWDAKEGNFDGFVAYDVSLVDGISERFNVSHVNTIEPCTSSVTLAGRSMVFNGTLTTMKCNTVKATNLNGTLEWELVL